MRHLSYLFVLLLSACASGPQQAILFPTPELPKQNLGHGTAITLMVVDERPDHVPFSRGHANVEAVIEQDVVGVIREQLMTGLINQGFVVGDGGGRSLEVAVQVISYSTPTAFFTGQVQARAILIATARNSHARYRGSYGTERAQQVFLIPFAEKRGGLLNKSVSDMLEAMFTDPKLMRVLVE